MEKLCKSMLKYRLFAKIIENYMQEEKICTIHLIKLLYNLEDLEIQSL
ncbi:MAG: hypothetical protein ACLRRH_05065 [Clostridium sp.]